METCIVLGWGLKTVEMEKLLGEPEWELSGPSVSWSCEAQAAA